MLLIDDDDGKAGLLKKNENGEWEFKYYENFIGGRNPAIRNKANVYVTKGHFNGDGKFTLKPDPENPRKESGTFFYAVSLYDTATGKWSNMTHTDCFPENTKNPQDLIDIKKEELDRTLNKTNGCTRLPVKMAKDIYDNCEEGLYVKIYEDKKFKDYTEEDQSDAIESWNDIIQKAETKEDKEKYERQIREKYGDEVYGLLAKKEERRKNKIVSQKAKMKEDKEKYERQIRENYGDEIYDIVAKEEERRKNEGGSQLVDADITKYKKEPKET